MVLSLGVILAVILAWMTLRPHDPDGPRVDYAAQLQQARAAAPYHLLAPAGLSPRWRATGAHYDPDVRGAAEWHVGFVTPHHAFAGVEQTNGRARPFIYSLSNRGLPDGTLRVGAVTWTRYYRASRDIRTLARTAGGSTVLVTGTAGYDELAQLAAALR
jgi:hypothetical protein